MGTMSASTSVKEMETRAVIIRADGTVEDLGVVAYYSRNPLKRLAYKLKGKFNG